MTRLVGAMIALACAAFAVPANAEGMLPVGKMADAAGGVSNNWTGFYVGGGAGYQVGDTGMDLNCGECGAVDPYTILRADGVSGRGWAADARLGFDWQVPNTVFVIGALGGYNWGDIGDNGHDPDFATTISGSLEQTWYAGGRLGVAMPSKTLAYVGYGWTQANVTASRGSSGEVLASASKTANGQMLLAGIEQMITPTITLGAEYTLSRFDDMCFDLDRHALNVEPDVHAFKIRLNWRPFSK